MRRFPDYVNSTNVRNLRTAFYDMNNNSVGYLAGINWQPSSVGYEGYITFSHLFHQLDNEQRYFLHIEYDCDEGHKFFWIENIEIMHTGVTRATHIRFNDIDTGGVRLGRR